MAHNKSHQRPVEANDIGTLQRYVRALPIRLRPHVTYIIVLCSLVTIPMVTFTIVLLRVIFSNVIDKTPCLYPELCPGPGLINATSRHFYYINFPAARLTLISSLSSSVSLTLVGALMAIYAYVEAGRIVSRSRATEASEQYQFLNPYQFSMLIRVLNTDFLALCELGYHKIKNVFWRMDYSDSQKIKQESRNMLHSSVVVFVSCILGSMLIQAADTYFHICAESLNLVQINSLHTSDHRYSRGLAPWCLDAESVGSSANKHFWSCVIHFNETRRVYVLRNSSEVTAIMLGKLTNSKILNYTDPEKVDYSIIAPYGVDLDIDWTGSTYGVSTQCSLIPENACTLEQWDRSPSANVPFSCPESLTGFNISGNTSMGVSLGHFFDSHRYLNEVGYFDKTIIPELRKSKSNATIELAKTLTDKNDNDTFRNPWHLINMANLHDDVAQRNYSVCQDQRTWKLYGCGSLMFFCNTTVWDITYGAINQEVVWINKTKSNGTVAGIASMGSLPGFGFGFTQALAVADMEAYSIESYLKIYQSAMSHYISIPIATQTSPREALLVQRRDSQVVTRLPTSALWVLVTANLLFMIISIILAVLALIFGSTEAHQVRSQLGVTGLVAQLLGNQDSDRGVISNSDLFKEISSGGGDSKGHVNIKVSSDESVQFQLMK